MLLKYLSLSTWSCWHYVHSNRNYEFHCIYLPVAVVGCRPHSEHSLVEVPFVALHDQLVCSTDHMNVVGGVKLGHHVTPKQIASTSGTHPPPCGVWGREDQSGEDSVTECQFSLYYAKYHFFQCSQAVFKWLDRMYTFRVWPQEITHGPIVGHFLFPVNGPDLVQCLDGRWQATVHTEDLNDREECINPTD